MGVEVNVGYIYIYCTLYSTGKQCTIFLHMQQLSPLSLPELLPINLQYNMSFCISSMPHIAFPPSPQGNTQ